MYEGLGYSPISPIDPLDYNLISEAEMLDYKKHELIASDLISNPEENATTAWDEYSKEIALNWLETEGYDTVFWRYWTRPDIERMITPGFETIAIISYLFYLEVFIRKKRVKKRIANVNSP